jgi:hypothetical protein
MMIHSVLALCSCHNNKTLFSSGTRQRKSLAITRMLEIRIPSILLHLLQHSAKPMQSKLFCDSEMRPQGAQPNSTLSGVFEDDQHASNRPTDSTLHTCPIFSSAHQRKARFQKL